MPALERIFCSLSCIVIVSLKNAFLFQQQYQIGAPCESKKEDGGAGSACPHCAKDRLQIIHYVVMFLLLK